MIGFNGTYLPAATHHGMRITAACLGGQWVFNYKWLTHATQQAILAAFGEEGMVVISKTNDYLNAIALTDTARAQQLADFIQEDPLLVCSLVETSKVRYIQNTQGAYIDTGIIPTDHVVLNFETTVAWEGMDKYEECVFASIGNSNAGTGIYGLVFHGTPNSASFMCGKYNEGAATKLAKTISRTKIVGLHNNGGVEVYVNDEYISRGTVSSLSNKTIWVFLPNGYYWHLVSGYNAVYKLETLRFYEEDTDIAHFIPMQRTDGTCGMLDIISGTFHPNANTKGAFTIQLTDKA